MPAQSAAQRKKVQDQTGRYRTCYPLGCNAFIYMMEKSYTLQEVTILLGKIAPKTLRQWMRKIDMRAVQDKHDPRRWLLSRAQVEHLAQLHGRTLPPDTPAKSADPLAALERRVKSLESRLADALARRDALEHPIVSIAPQTHSQPRQPAPPAPSSQPTLVTQEAASAPTAPQREVPTQKPRRHRKAFTIDWRAWEWLGLHGIPLAAMRDWHDVPLDTHANALDYAKEQGHPPRRCRDDECPCRDVLD